MPVPTAINVLASVPTGDFAAKTKPIIAYWSTKTRVKIIIQKRLIKSEAVHHWAVL